MGKTMFIVIFLMVHSISYSQKVFLNEDDVEIHSIITIQLTQPDTIINYSNTLTFDFVEDKDQIIRLSCADFSPVLITVSDFLNTDTIYFYFKAKSIEEFIVSSKAIRRESHDTLHVVDFHFVNGQLFSIRKSIRDLQKKYLCKGDNCFEVNNRTKLIQNDLNNEQVVEIKDSVYLFDGNKLSFLAEKKVYNQKFPNFLGNHKDKYYYEGHFFYHLIDEYVYFDVQTGKNIPIYITYDSTSLYFVSQQYRKVPIYKSDPYLIYAVGAKKGKIFKNEEGIQFSKPIIQSSPIFKKLVGSPSFIQMLPILEKSRSEAYLLDSTLYVIDFNKSCLVTFTNGIYASTLELPLLQNVWYRNQFAIDEKTKKCYFYVKEENKHRFVELDLLNGNVRKLKSPEFYNSIYHWEVWDGRFYFLISNDTKVDWQRVFYSYSINDPGMN